MKIIKRLHQLYEGKLFQCTFLLLSDYKGDRNTRKGLEFSEFFKKHSGCG